MMIHESGLLFWATLYIYIQSIRCCVSRRSKTAKIKCYKL